MSCNGRIQRLVREYNSIPRILEISFDMAKDTSNPLYQGCARTNEVPVSVRRQAMLHYNLIHRAEEESLAVTNEAEALLSWWKERQDNLETSFSDASGGAQAKIRCAQLEIEQQLKQISIILRDTFQIIANIETPVSDALMVPISDVIVPEEFVIDEFVDLSDNELLSDEENDG